MYKYKITQLCGPGLLPMCNWGSRAHATTHKANAKSLTHLP